jgi:pilus assembly protein CpaF
LATYTDAIVAEVRARDQRGASAEADIEAVANRLFPLLSPAEKCDVVASAQAELFGLGGLDALLLDRTITEIMINGTGDTWIERGGQLFPIDAIFDSAGVLRVIERILAPLGHRVDRLHPTVDARLPDGSRVHAVIPPVAVDGPCLTIRRFSENLIPLDRLTTPAQHEVLRDLVRNRRSLVVCGATGSGKTTLLNALASFLEPTERVITIEDTAELRLGNAHVVRLEARIATSEGLGEVTLRDLVRTSLRMRPDRIVVGEVRGPEALDMVQAMSTGHPGSMSTVHADSPPDALRRLELMVMMAGVGLNLDAAREQLDMAIDAIVHVARCADGSRQVQEIARVSRTPAGAWHLEPTA